MSFRPIENSPIGWNRYSAKQSGSFDYRGIRAIISQSRQIPQSVDRRDVCLPETNEAETLVSGRGNQAWTVDFVVSAQVIEHDCGYERVVVTIGDMMVGVKRAWWCSRKGRLT